MLFVGHIPELSNAEVQLSALTSLEENVASELRYLEQRYAEATFDKTWQGRLFVLMHHATGFYCIFRSFVVRFSRGNVCTHALLTASVPFERLPPCLTPDYHVW